MSAVDDFFEAVDRAAKSASGDRLTALATVDPGYTSGNPRITFDGETSLSTRAYPTMAAVAAGSRVGLVRFGNSWVIVGQIL